MTVFKIFSKDILSLLFENLSYEDYCKFICVSKYIYTLSNDISYYLDMKIYNMGFISKRLKSLKSFENLPNIYFNKNMIFINDQNYFQNNLFLNRLYFENSLKYVETFIFEPRHSIWDMDHYDYIKDYNRDMKIISNYTFKKSNIKKYSNSNSNSNSKIYKEPRYSNMTLDENTILNHILCHSKNLKRFEIKDYIHVHIYVDCMLYNLPSTLKILNLSGIVNMNDELLDIVTSHTPILLKLDISKANISNKGLFYLHRLKNLNTCNLSFTKIKDESFEIIGKLPNLQKLDISMCNLITNNGIEILVKLNPNLTHLSMEYTNVGQLAVNYMTDYMKHPIYINMNYTHHSSFINVSFLKKKCKILTYKSI